MECMVSFLRLGGAGPGGQFRLAVVIKGTRRRGDLRKNRWSVWYQALDVCG